MKLKHRTLLMLAGGLAAALAGPLLIPVPPLKGTRPPAALADEDSQFIELDGLDIHAKKFGQGEPVFVLLHGFAASLYSWNAVFEPFSQLGSVIAYDRPGFGLSARPLAWRGRNPYSVEAQVGLVTSLLDHFEVSQAILVGHSAGGTLAMQVALDFPQRVQALILVDSAVYHAGGAPGWLHPLLASPQMRRLGPLFTRQILASGRGLIRLAWHDPRRLTPEMEDYYLKPTRVENWDKALWEFSLASRPSALKRRLPGLSMPVLVVTGDDDRIVPTQESIRLARELRNARLEVVQQAGHLPHEEQPGAFMDAVIRFIKQLEREE